MRRTTRSLLAVFAAATLLTGCEVNPQAPQRTSEGLRRVVSRNVDELYRAPNTSLKPYRRVLLEPLEIAFKQDWQRQHPEVTAQDIARIREKAAALFREEVERDLADKGGYALTTDIAPDVLRVNASITDLDFTAPGSGVSATGRSFIVSTADMTLRAELRDSKSGALLVRVVDRPSGGGFGNLQIVDQANQSDDARRAVAKWSGLLRTALDEARNAP